MLKASIHFVVEHRKMSSCLQSLMKVFLSNVPHTETVYLASLYYQKHCLCLNRGVYNGTHDAPKVKDIVCVYIEEYTIGHMMLPRCFTVTWSQTLLVPLLYCYSFVLF